MPTYLELAYNGNYVGKTYNYLGEIFTYKGKVFGAFYNHEVIELKKGIEPFIN